MPTIQEIALVVASWGCVYAYRMARRAKYPERLDELVRALRLHADLFRHRNRDLVSAEELSTLAEHLDYARALANSPAGAVAREWPGHRYFVRHSIDPDILKTIDLFHSARRGQISSAVFDLEKRLDKKARAAR